MSARDNPFDELERMFERLSRQFEGAGRWWEGEPLEDWRSGFDQLPVDLVDQGDEFVVTVDVPGYDRNEIDVRVSDRTLRIEADKREEVEEREDEFIRRERRHRGLSRSIQLPDEVEPDGVTARLKNGILTITVPKAEPTEESRTIEIDSE